jgi:DNA-binding XRE family transcriptional regulator
MQSGPELTIAQAAEVLGVSVNSRRNGRPTDVRRRYGAARGGADGLPAPSLQAWRIKVGLTQLELAERAGVRRATITRIETGGPARIKTVRALATAMGCSIDDLRHQPD